MLTHKQVPGSLQDSRPLCQALEALVNKVRTDHRSCVRLGEALQRQWLCCGSSQERWTCIRTKEQRRFNSCVALQPKTLSANPDDPGTHVVEGKKWVLQIVLYLSTYTRHVPQPLHTPSKINKCFRGRTSISGHREQVQRFGGFPRCIGLDLGKMSRTEAGKQVMGKSRRTLKDKGHSSGAQHFLTRLLDCYSVIQNYEH